MNTIYLDNVVRLLDYYEGRQVWLGEDDWEWPCREGLRDLCGFMDLRGWRSLRLTPHNVRDYIYGHQDRDTAKDHLGWWFGERLVPMTGLDLRELDTTGNWSRYDFTGSRFAGGFPWSTAFSRCNLTGADFTGADLSRLHFYGCILSGAKGLEGRTSEGPRFYTF